MAMKEKELRPAELPVWEPGVFKGTIREFTLFKIVKKAPDIFKGTVDKFAAFKKESIEVAWKMIAFKRMGAYTMRWFVMAWLFRTND